MKWLTALWSLKNDQTTSHSNPKRNPRRRVFGLTGLHHQSGFENYWGFEMEPLKWKKGPPPHIGWWNASFKPFSDISHDEWRWWNGDYWSVAAYNILDSEAAADNAMLRTGVKNIKWSDYWPENARVPRIAP